MKTLQEKRAARVLSEDAIRDILTSAESCIALARRYGRSASTITLIRRGQLHAQVLPDLPRQNLGGQRLDCTRCQHWRGDHCDLGHPDPIEDGVKFAAWCNNFKLITADQKRCA